MSALPRRAPGLAPVDHHPSTCGSSGGCRAQGDQSLLANGCEADDSTDPDPDPTDDQCPDGANPGDVDADGDSDLADCTAVLDEDGEDGGNAGNGGGPGTTPVVSPAGGSTGTRPQAPAPEVLVPNLVNAGVDDVVTEVSAVPTTGRPFAGGPLLLMGAAALLGLAAVRPRARHAHRAQRPHSA